MKLWSMVLAFALALSVAGVAGAQEAKKERKNKGGAALQGKVSSVDAAGNVKETATRVVRVDGTAPSAPLAVEAGPEVWTSEAVRELSWLNPGQDAAPIAGASLKVCRRFTSDCLEVAGDSTTAHSLQLPSPGEFEVSVWLADEAGNSASRTREQPKHRTSASGRTYAASQTLRR